MENNKQNTFTEEEESSFDIMEWVSVILHHWYLFVIGVIIALGLAYLQNRKWIPAYKSAGTMIIEEYRAQSNTQALMQGFGVSAGYKNVSNQVIMMGSYDLIGKVVDSLPQLRIDYLTMGNFKKRNLYNTSPILIQADYIASEAYGLLYRLSSRADGTFSITIEDNKQYSNFRINGKFGEPLQHNLFFVTIQGPANYSNYTINEIYFQFRTRESLIGDFMARLKFNYVVEGSSVLELSLVSQEPARDVDFINKLSETFLMDNLNRKNDAANKTIEFIDTQLGNVSKSLSESEGEMTDFRQRNQIIDVSSYAGILMSKAQGFDVQLSNLKLRETYLNYLMSYLKTNLEDGSVVAPSSLGLSEPMLMSLVQQVNDLNLKRSELSEKNVFYAKYTRDIENVKTAILEVTKSMRAALDIEKEDQRKRSTQVQDDINRLPQKEIEMISIERKYKMDDNYYTFFLQKRAEAEILKSSNTPDNLILDKARTLNMTNGDTKKKTTTTYLLFGLLLPAVIVVLKHLLSANVKTTKDVEKNSSFPLLGMVRHTNSIDPLLVSKNPRSSYTETFRVLRTRIEFIVQRKSNITLLITSGESGDGKTYFCINLAGIYAMTNKKTLLIDLDIRKPSINSRFNLSQTNGVTNYLIGQCTLDEVIVSLPEVEFDLLPGGTIPPNAGELVRSEQLADMITELKKRYEFIIIDTSPIGIVADAYSLLTQSDLNLYIARANKTNKNFMKKFTAQLKEDKFYNFYTVLNDVTFEENQYSKYSSKKYGYGYGYGYGYTSRFNKRKQQDEANKYFQYYQDDREL